MNKRQLKKAMKRVGMKTMSIYPPHFDAYYKKWCKEQKNEVCQHEEEGKEESTQ